MLGTVLMCFSFVLAVLAAFNWPPQSRVHLGWAAFAFFIAAQLFGSVAHLFR